MREQGRPTSEAVYAYRAALARDDYTQTGTLVLVKRILGHA